jgi:hypothetical protein
MRASPALDPLPLSAIYVSNCSIAPASGMGPKLCPAGGQVVSIV